MLKHADLLKLDSFIIDDTCYPWVAYKGPRFGPTESHWCYSAMESMLLRERDLNAAGYFLRDDWPIREGVECFKGIEEAYSLHTINPFQRHGVFGGPREHAVREAHKQVFPCEHKNVIAGQRIPLRWGSTATEVCGDCGCYRTMFRSPGAWTPGPVPTDEDDEV